MRKIAVALSALMLVGVLGSAQAAPVTVWEDDTGDADAAQGLGGSIPGGFDLVSGALARNKANLDFTVTVADMPPGGTLPEGFRFLWAFAVGSTSYRITAKSADIGKPDVLAQNGTERVGKVDPMGHFRLEGDCKAGETIGVVQPINCQPLAYITGAFDAASASFTVSVPMKLIKAKKGSVISQGSGDAAGICTICWVSHTAERSHSDTIIDTALMTGKFKIK